MLPETRNATQYSPVENILYPDFSSAQSIDAVDIESLSDDDLADWFFSQPELQTIPNQENLIVSQDIQIDDSHIRQEISQENLRKTRKAMDVFSNAVNVFPNLFSSTGAFCGHCISGFTGVMGGANAGGSSIMGGLKLGHRHTDGSWHDEDHDNHEKKASSNSVSHSRQTMNVSRSAPATRSSTSTFSLFPSNTISLSQALSPGKPSINVRDFVSSLVA